MSLPVVLGKLGKSRRVLFGRGHVVTNARKIIIDEGSCKLRRNLTITVCWTQAPEAENEVALGRNE